ncbi:hypothetical protein D3C78_1712010 [compost metagenome]
MLADDEGFEPHAVHQDVLGLGNWNGLAVAGDHAAQCDARERVRVQQHGVEDHAADILEVTVDAVGTGLLQGLRK